MNKKRTNRANDIIQLVVGIAVILLFNYVGRFTFHRFDLTTDHRYSLSPSTKKTLENLKDIVFIKVYLQGDFPAPYQKLHNETKNILEQFKAYAGSNIQFKFINPSNAGNEQLQNQVYNKLAKEGLQYSTINSKEQGGESQKIVWPGAILSYKGKQVPIQLLKSEQYSDIEDMVNGSIENLEYAFISAINNIKRIKKPSVAFIEGQGELDQDHVADFAKALSKTYAVDRIRINGQLSALTERDSTAKGDYVVIPKYKAIIIAKPDSTFTEKDKFIIDQYLMYGGTIMWLIDPLYANMDSLRKQATFMAMPKKLNILQDMLFEYGARVNKDLVLDMRSAPIPMITGYTGNQPKTQFFPWYYFPIVVPKGNQPIVNNLGPIKCEFVSSVDTVGNPSIKKTILLTSSQYSRKIDAPVRVSLNIMRFKPNPQLFTDAHIPIAVLLEGKFKSVFKNRIVPKIANSRAIAFKTKSYKTKQIVIGDGDMISNYVNRATGQYYELGYDHYTQQVFDNKSFLLNCINYLCDNKGLMELRGKKFKIRLLSDTKVKQAKMTWQIINMITPLLIILILGLSQYFIRKRKFTFEKR